MIAGMSVLSLKSAGVPQAVGVLVLAAVTLAVVAFGSVSARTPGLNYAVLVPMGLAHVAACRLPDRLLGFSVFSQLFTISAAVIYMVNSWLG